MSTMKVVYRFTKYDIVTDNKPIGRRFATLEAIDRIKGIAIKDSLWTVDAECVDGDGFYCGPPLAPIFDRGSD